MGEHRAGRKSLNTSKIIVNMSILNLNLRKLFFSPDDDEGFYGEEMNPYIALTNEMEAAGNYLKAPHEKTDAPEPPQKDLFKTTGLRDAIGKSPLWNRIATLFSHQS